MTKRRLTDLIRTHHGPLSTELVREPGRFGLGQVPARLAPDSTTSMVCGFCSTGCSLDVHMKNGEAVNLTPTVDYPVNLGKACPKGWEALAPLCAPDRATTPLLRDEKGTLQPVDWQTAIATFVERCKAIQGRYGNDAIAFLSTGQIPTEEMALLGALAKFGMGLVHGDGNTRQCMASAVVAYKQSFGFDAPPYTYADFEESDVIVLIGSNLCIAHPIMWERVRPNPPAPEIVVVDPRTTETAMAATQHYALLPKSDLVLLYGIAHQLIARGWIDREYIATHTAAFDDFAAHVAPFTSQHVAETTGLTVGQLERFASTIHEGERVSFWWTMGVNQSHEGVLTAEAIVALALMTGNIGRPGTGANSVTGQCNAMGSRLFANTTSLLGGRDFAEADHRAQVAEILDLPVEVIPTSRSLAYDQIIEGVVKGTVRGLWVVGTNPGHSWINRSHLDDVIGRLEFLVVQDMYATTETVQRADLVLPAAGWGEKEGTFINSERRVGLIKRVTQAPGQALADFHIFRLIAEAWGCADLFASWDSPEAVFRDLQRLSAGRPCDITGIEGYEHLDRAGGIQWPHPAAGGAAPAESARGPGGDPLPERRLFADGRFFTPDGRARFRFGDPRPPGEHPTPRYPIVLLTGRGSAAQWHTQTRTGKSPLLRSLAPGEPYVEIAPADAATRGIGEGDRVVVRSPRGETRARAFITPTVPDGCAFLSMHWSGTNLLTRPVFDPSSRQPSYKHCTVEISKPPNWE
jgi:assimilatory nitrate reductase catalytic subunit